VPIGKARTVRDGSDLTIVATSHMTIEALRAADVLAREGISAEVIDVRTLKPFDTEHLLESVGKTRRLIVADAAWRTGGFAGEIIAQVVESIDQLAARPRRLTLPDVPTPSTPALADHYYPRAVHIVNAARNLWDLPERSEAELGIVHEVPLDVPDRAFLGPF